MTRAALAYLAGILHDVLSLNDASCSFISVSGDVCNFIFIAANDTGMHESFLKDQEAELPGRLTVLSKAYWSSAQSSPPQQVEGDVDVSCLPSRSV